MPTVTNLSVSNANISDSQLSYLLDYYFITAPVPTIDENSITVFNKSTSAESVGDTFDVHEQTNLNSITFSQDIGSSFWTISNSNQGLIPTSDIGVSIPVIVIGTSTSFDDNNGVFK